jgi:hypothetical protein
VKSTNLKAKVTFFEKSLTDEYPAGHEFYEMNPMTCISLVLGRALEFELVCGPNKVLNV